MCSTKRGVVEYQLDGDEVWEWEEWQAAELDDAVTGGLVLDSAPRASDDALMGRMLACEAMISRLTAEQAHSLRELRRRRLVTQAAEHPHDGGTCPGACCDDDGWVAAEVGMPLGLSERQVQSRIDTALRLQRFREVEGLLDAGLVQSWTAMKALEHLETFAAYVTPGRLAAVESATVAWLAIRPRTVGQLNARMRRLILAAKAASRPGPAGPVPDPAEGRRKVTVTPASTPGWSELVALLPEADALAVRATLLALAHDRTDDHDRRTTEQRRADLLVTLVTGSPASYGRPGDARCALRDAVEIDVHLDVTIPASSLLGGTAPGRVAGYGDIPAGTARDLAFSSGAAALTGAACRARPLVYDPRTGRLTGFGATAVRMTWLHDLAPSRGYEHSGPVETAVHVRDGTCRAPGCSRSAARCDCDHVVPYPAGPTSLANSCSLCRRHHRLKTHAAGWHVSIDDGVVTWTTPSGRTLTTEPHDYRAPTEPHDYRAPTDAADDEGTGPPTAG
jgi:hypothetical protein